MKNYLLLLTAAVCFVLFSCSSSETEKRETEGENTEQSITPENPKRVMEVEDKTRENTDPNTDASTSTESNTSESAVTPKQETIVEELKPHVCNSNCNQEEGCFFKHGEIGHACSSGCKKS